MAKRRRKTRGHRTPARNSKGRFLKKGRRQK